jgi:hypothetical protein
MTIDTDALVAALQAHALGQEKMASTQVSAAIALLKKVMPDLPVTAHQRMADIERRIRTHEEALKELE